MGLHGLSPSANQTSRKAPERLKREEKEKREKIKRARRGRAGEGRGRENRERMGGGERQVVGEMGICPSVALGEIPRSPEYP